MSSPRHQCISHRPRRSAAQPRGRSRREVRGSQSAPPLDISDASDAADGMTLILACGLEWNSALARFARHWRHDLRTRKLMRHICAWDARRCARVESDYMGYVAASVRSCGSPMLVHPISMHAMGWLGNAEVAADERAGAEQAQFGQGRGQDSEIRFEWDVKHCRLGWGRGWIGSGDGLPGPAPLRLRPHQLRLPARRPLRPLGPRRRRAVIAEHRRLGAGPPGLARGFGGADGGVPRARPRPAARDATARAAIGDGRGRAPRDRTRDPSDWT